MIKLIVGFLGLGLLAGAAAAAGDPVSRHLDNCNIDGSACLARVTDVIVNGRDTHYICIPPDVSTHDAVHREIGWLEDAGRGNPKIANMDMENALWTGATTLWPCHHGTVKQATR